MHFKAAALVAVACFLPAVVFGTGSTVDPKELGLQEKLEKLRKELDKAQGLWEESIDDPVSDRELKRNYEALQDECRALYKRKGGFGTARQKQLCEVAQYPHEMYYNELLIKVNNLKKQLFQIDTPGTVANDYYNRPSKDNLEKLRNIFEKVNKYYVGAPYTWNRYYNKYLFSRSRLDHALEIWQARLADYKAALKEGVEQRAREVARRRAEFAFKKLEEESQKNNLSFCGKVGAFYLAQNLDDYLVKEKEWEETAGTREKAGRKKEVVIFIHGMGEDRGNWRKFPVLLAQEDMADASLDRYFQVYVFRYDTVEDSKSVEGFRRELAGFIRDILKNENVQHVNLVGHSLGGVLSLKYLVQYIDEQVQSDPLPKDQVAKAAKLIHGYLDGQYRRPVARFVGIAPSLSGSEVANVMAGIFKRQPPLYERSLSPFQSGIPIAGDLQVLENQIGSRVNLNSFTRLDFERPLDPYALLELGSDEERAKIDAVQMEKLHAMQLKTLMIIGRHALEFPFLTGPEDDGMVRCYSANLNHIYMADADAKSDIGYRAGNVRYAPVEHNQLIEVEDRKHPSYGYAVSFLCDKLIPQQDRNAANVRHFICLLRTYPDFFDIDENPESCFYPEERTYFTNEERYELPGLQVRVLGGSVGSSNAQVYKSSWNPFTGVCYLEGKQDDIDKPAWISLELSAPGFKTKVVHVPVSGGLVTYCVRLKLAQESDKGSGDKVVEGQSLR